MLQFQKTENWVSKQINSISYGCYWDRDERSIFFISAKAAFNRKVSSLQVLCSFMCIHQECMDTNWPYLLLALDKMDRSQSNLSNKDSFLSHRAVDMWTLLRLWRRGVGICPIYLPSWLVVEISPTNFWPLPLWFPIQLWQQTQIKTVQENSDQHCQGRSQLGQQNTCQASQLLCTCLCKSELSTAISNEPFTS